MLLEAIGAKFVTTLKAFGFSKLVMVNYVFNFLIKVIFFNARLEPVDFFQANRTLTKLGDVL